MGETCRFQKPAKSAQQSELQGKQQAEAVEVPSTAFPLGFLQSRECLCIQSKERIKAFS